MSVDALQIWQQLSESDKCREAVRHYRLKYRSFFSTEGMMKKDILKQGSADFDQKYCADDENEKNHYRTDYYVHGYMDMHLQQNLVAFRHCFKDKIPQSLLLVDFGCGPMTSGLALAEGLSKQMPDYKTHAAYFGIDVSRNMVDKAKHINEEYKLFEHFEVVQDTRFDAQKIPCSFSTPQIIALCFSYVLAPNTYKPDVPERNAIAKLVTDWNEYVENQPRCRETKIIYLNPLNGSLHFNWHDFKATLTTSTQNIAGQFCYTTDDRYFKLSGDCPDAYYWMICGTRK